MTARQIGADRIVTGHYAAFGSKRGNGPLRTVEARDDTKDQSYFLFGLTQEQLERTKFPLGEFTKAEVRAIARRAQLPVAEKPESQEICFVPSGNYVQFIEAYLGEQGSTLPAESGEIVTTSGEVIGRHEGVHQFTVGQRKGLGVGRRTSALRFVTRSRKRPRRCWRKRRAAFVHVRSSRRKLD